jgi:hypothetical protein
MKNYSLLIRLVVCGALLCSTFCLSQSSSYGQGRSLTVQQLDAIVKPSLAQCSAPATPTKNARLDPYSIIPTANARAFPTDRVVRTLHGLWRGQVIGNPVDTRYETSREGNVDYFWIIDTQRNEGLIIALRNGNNSLAGIGPLANAPKLSYLICAHDGYLPTVERGSEIHEFTKVADSIEDAPKILQKATGVAFKQGQTTLSQYWQSIVASGYFSSLPAVAFAGGLFKPMRVESVSSANGPAQISMSWDSEYYGGGTTGIRFTPGVPMRGVEYTTFIGTTASGGDFLVASPGNGKLAKVEAFVGGDYDLAFDAASFGPLQSGTMIAGKRAPRTANRKSNHLRRNK